MNRLRLVFWFALLTDVISKAWSWQYLDHYGRSVAIPGVMDFWLLVNYGAGFGGMGDGSPGEWWMLPLRIVALALVAFVASIRKDIKPSPSSLEMFGLTLALAGWTGNVFEQIVSGGVIDFLYAIPLGRVFNVADVWVTIGLLCLLLAYLGSLRRRLKTTKES